MSRAACTIVSLNYLPYARVLCESFLRFHPDYKFYVLLVDRLPQDFDVSGERFDLVLVEDLGIPNFDSIAFKFDILELNTNVKPTFLKNILNRGVRQLIYFDPDICLYNDAEFIFDLVEKRPIVLTPHCISPTQESDRNLEQAFLSFGVFNLGFVAVSSDTEAFAFLNWWEQRCLSSGFSEPQTGLFVDQKWVNLVPCLFDNVHILKHCGCNVAYWNLFERQISTSATGYLVNQTQPLVFFHFSGIDTSDREAVSTRGSSRSTVAQRPDIATLFDRYKQDLRTNRLPDLLDAKYAYGSFSNGVQIPRLIRRIYASALQNEEYQLTPFDSNGEFYKFSKKTHLINSEAGSDDPKERNYRKSDLRFKIVHKMFRLLLRLLGVERYTLLLGYLAFLCVHRNQIVLFETELGAVEGHPKLSKR
jgi:hypothetical protein